MLVDQYSLTRIRCIDAFLLSFFVSILAKMKWLYWPSLNHNWEKLNMESFHVDPCKIGHPPNSWLINASNTSTPSVSIVSSFIHEVYSWWALAIAVDSFSRFCGNVERRSSNKKCNRIDYDLLVLPAISSFNCTSTLLNISCSLTENQA